MVGAVIALLDIKTTATRSPPVAANKASASKNTQRYRGGICLWGRLRLAMNVGKERGVFRPVIGSLAALVR